jgi:hypothetical protein
MAVMASRKAMRFRQKKKRNYFLSMAFMFGIGFMQREEKSRMLFVFMTTISPILIPLLDAAKI